MVPHAQPAEHEPLACVGGPGGLRQHNSAQTIGVLLAEEPKDARNVALAGRVEMPFSWSCCYYAGQWRGGRGGLRCRGGSRGSLRSRPPTVARLDWQGYQAHLFEQPGLVMPGAFV